VYICAMPNRPGTTQSNCGPGPAQPTLAVPGPQVKPMGRPDTTHLTKAHRDPLNIDSVFN
jgi:hypothetical protein